MPIFLPPWLEYPFHHYLVPTFLPPEVLKKITLMRQSIGMKSTENKNTTHNILSSVHFLLKRGKWTHVIGAVHSVQI